MAKEDVVHICNGILLSHKKEQNNTICSFGGSRDYQSKWSKSERERQIPYHLHVESKIWRTWTFLRNRRRFTDIQNRDTIAKGEKGQGSDEVGIWVTRCKLFYTEWINNIVLLYSTGNYIQYPVINHNGKNIFLNVYLYNRAFQVSQ